MKRYVMWRVILILCILQCFMVGYLAGRAYGEEYKGEYYEKEGCVYLIGNLTNREKLAGQEHYKARMAKREAQVKVGIQRSHKIEIETIKAQAMRDYLIAQGMPLREIADAYKRIRVRQSVVIGDITNTSEGGAGGSATNINTSTNTNSATGGSGGTSTHNDY